MVGVPALLTDATRRLAAAGVSSPRVDAELLLADLLGVARGALLTLAAVPDDAAERFEQRVRRRIAREPLQHIVGTAAFRHVEVAVGSGVFVPRPETELLVDAVLPYLRAAPRPLAVDLCAGSGALALAIADEVPGARVVAVERSADALSWLRRNVAGAVEVVAADVRDADLLAELRGRVDAVVANPPYVPESTHVAPEVEADPAEAVFAGTHGLDLIPAVCARAGELLRTGGVLAVEHDESHGPQVAALLDAGEWTGVAEHADLAGRPRYVTAVRRPAPEPYPGCTSR